jgi:hypothetical protein
MGPEKEPLQYFRDSTANHEQLRRDWILVSEEFRQL